MRVVFLGSTTLGEKVLKALIDAKVNVVLSITETSKKGNRGKMTLPIVKQVSDENNIPCLQFEKLCVEGLDEIKKVKPDLMITAAYGQILTEEFLSIAQTINVHPSILPKYRGATPIQSAVLNGDETTGVTVLKTVKALDAGDILLCKKFEIKKDETSGELFERASIIGGQCAIEAIKLIESGKAVFTKQDNEKATKCRQIKKENCQIDFSMPAEKLVNFIRAYNPWPVAFAFYDGKLFKIFKALKSENKNLDNGKILIENKKLFVGCGNGETLELIEIQMEGGKKMFARDFLNGKKIEGSFDGK